MESGLQIKSAEDLRRCPTQEDIVDPRLIDEEQTDEKTQTSEKDIESQAEVLYVR